MSELSHAMVCFFLPTFISPVNEVQSFQMFPFLWPNPSWGVPTSAKKTFVFSPFFDKGLCLDIGNMYYKDDPSHVKRGKILIIWPLFFLGATYCINLEEGG